MHRTGFFGLLLALGACTPQTSGQSAVANYDTGMAIAQLQDQVNGLKHRLDVQETASKNDAKTLYDLKTPKETDYMFTTVDCAGHGYGATHASGTALTVMVMCEDVKNYLGGSSIKLQIGNPHSMGFSGMTYTLGTGADALSAYIALQDNSKNLTGRFTEEFRSAYWTRVTVNVPKTKPEDARFVAISLGSDVVQLYNPKGQ